MTIPRRPNRAAKTKSEIFIALLRGINVGGKNKIPMADLRTLCTGLGWQNVQTYIQSGNAVFHAAARPSALQESLERGILDRFGLSIPVLVRSAEQWIDYMKGNPLSAASVKDPGLVHLALAQSAPAAGALAELRRRADTEQIEQVGEAFWVYYPLGAGRSKLTPAVFDRLVGSPVTARNWRTVQKLGLLAAQR